MSELFNLPIDASTRYCAVFGHPVRHSASPAFQNAGIAALGLNWRYLAFDVDPKNLLEAIAGAKQMGFIGVNLTVPHKLLAMDMLDVLDESARTWGAVNTVRFEAKDEGGMWVPLHSLGVPPSGVPISDAIRTHGFNTDADAIVQSLREDLGVELNGAKVLLVGAGGAGRVAAMKLASENVAALYLVNRTPSKAETVVQEINRRWPRVKAAANYPAEAVDLVINATSLGLGESDALPFDSSSFSLRHARAAYDMIYRPAETLFLKLARAAGCRTANGLGMLLYQGAKALELWSGRPAPMETMRRALETNVYG